MSMIDSGGISSGSPSVLPIVLSVGILTRNSARTLSETLDSLERQTMPTGAWDLFVVDHNSQDGTRQLLEDYAERQGNLRLFTRAENNLSRSRQLIVDLSTAKWIVFIDSDVVLSPQWLETALIVAEREQARDSAFSGVGAPLRLNPKSAQLCDLEIMQKHALGHFGTEQMEISAKPKRVSHLPTAAALFSRLDIQRHGGFDPACGDCGEDLELGERLSAAGRKFWIAPELLAEHLFSCETKGQWLARAIRFGRARVNVACLHRRMWKSPRLILPIFFALIQLALLVRALAGSAQSLALLVVVLLADLGFLFGGFLAFTDPWRALRVSALTFATHEAYAWGELREVVQTLIVAVRRRLTTSRQSVGRRIFGWADEIEALALQGVRTGTRTIDGLATGVAVEIAVPSAGVRRLVRADPVSFVFEGEAPYPEDRALRP